MRRYSEAVKADIRKRMSPRCRWIVTNRSGERAGRPRATPSPRAAPDPQAPQPRFGLLSAVGVPVAIADVLPVDKRCARGHQGLAEIVAAAEQVRPTSGRNGRW